MSTGPGPASPRVSVVIPVYNTVTYLAACLDSLVGQDLPADDIEIVAVDDGSTDGSGELLDRYEAAHANVRVVHQPNSGWPGQPRNRATAMSRGRYVFFLDSDDSLGVEAMRRLCDFADEHGSDLVAPRMHSDGGATRADRIWGRTTVDADPRLVFKTLTPQKLFRRSFLDEHDLRFPEGLVRLEDGILLSRAYLLAKRVSILGDYDFYFKRLRDAKDNISSRRMDPAGYLSSVRLISENVRSLSDDPEMSDQIVLDLYRRKALRRLRADIFLKYAQKTREKWVEQVAVLAESQIPRELQQHLRPVPRLQSELARRRDVAGVAVVAQAAGDGRRLPVVRSQGRLLLEVPGEAGRDITDVTGPDRALVLRDPPTGLTAVGARARSAAGRVLAKSGLRRRR